MPSAAPSLPRFQSGARSQQLLTVLLGDYWFARSDPIPSSALIDLLHIFGVSTSGARAAIQRLAQRGVLRGVKHGRQTAYGVPPMSQEKINWHVQSLFRSHLPQEWNGRWTVVAYSVPEDAKELRRTLRDELRQMRFGNLYDALWIRPGDHDVRRALGSLVDDVRLTVFSDSRIPSDDDSIRTAFRLDDLADMYRDFSARWDELARSLDGANPVEISDLMRHQDPHPGDEALRLRTSVMTEWRELRRHDPRLPHELLGADYPLHRAVEIVSAIYDPLAPLAESAVRRILERHERDLAELVTHHTFAASARLIEA